MPLQTTLRKPSLPNELPKFRHHKADRLCTRMSELLIRHVPASPIRQAQNMLAKPRRPRIEVVEISDDDSDPPSPPLRSLASRSTYTKAPAVVQSNSDPESPTDSDALVSLARDRHRRHRKRPKLHTSPTDSSTQLANSGSYSASSQPKQLPNGGRHLALDLDIPPLRHHMTEIDASFPLKSNLSIRSAAPVPIRYPPSMPDPRLPSNSKTAVRTTETKAPAKRLVEEQSPYFLDLKLEAKMYRGAGYEKFPVALGTVPGHQEICNKWDARQASKKGKGQQDLHHNSLDNILRSIQISPATDVDAENSFMITEHETHCLAGVREVFPDIQINFVLERIRAHSHLMDLSEDDDVQEQVSALEIVLQILDLAEYPKQKLKGSRATHDTSTQDETGTTIQWDRDILKNQSYFKDAVILLANQFDHIPTHYIQKLVRDKKSVFDAYTHLHEVEAQYYNLHSRPYNRLRQPRVTIEKKYTTRNTYETRIEDQYLRTINELQAAKQYLAREAVKLSKEKEVADTEAANLAAHRATRSLIECQCCFDEEIPINRSVACEGDPMHFFCFGCVEQLAKTQVGSMKYEMLCMDGSGCKSTLSTEGVGRAVPIKTFDRLAFNQQQAEITAAGIDGLEQCAFCDFKAICEPIESDSVFDCQNPECGRVTCRKCLEEAHLPRSCEEIKIDRGLSARHQVEEARSEAMMRTCPKCKVKIIKELGCNKMRCTSCSATMCYVCKTDITNGKDGGYEHFNNRGAKCKLHDDAGVDRHEVEADEAEREAIKRAKATDAELDEAQLRVGTLLGQASKKNLLPTPVAPRWPGPQDLFAQDMAHVHDLQERVQRQHVAMLQAQRLVQQNYARHPHQRENRQPADLISNVAEPLAADMGHILNTALPRQPNGLMLPFPNLLGPYAAMQAAPFGYGMDAFQAGNHPPFDFATLFETQMAWLPPGTQQPTFGGINNVAPHGQQMPAFPAHLYGADGGNEGNGGGYFGEPVDWDNMELQMARDWEFDDDLPRA